MEKGIIVSIQGYSKQVTQEIATEVENAGAVALRIDKKVKAEIPLIGLLKAKNKEHFVEPYITHTLDDVKSVSAWADYVAIDYRRINENIKEISEYCQANDIKVIADIASIYDFYNIMDKGYYYTFIATTLSVFGYSNPNFWLIKEIIKSEKNLIAEGNFKTSQQVRRAAKAGAYAVCIGHAITGFYKKTIEFKKGFDHEF